MYLRNLAVFFKADLFCRRQVKFMWIELSHSSPVGNFLKLSYILVSNLIEQFSLIPLHCQRPQNSCPQETNMEQLHPF